MGIFNMIKGLVLSVLAISTLVSAQSMGNGISKYTRGHSDPQKCLAWFEKYLKATDAPDGCTNGKCECATQGRGQIGGSEVNTEVKDLEIGVTGPPGPGG